MKILRIKFSFVALNLKNGEGVRVKKYRSKSKECKGRLRKLRSYKDTHDIQTYNEVRRDYLNLL